MRTRSRQAPGSGKPTEDETTVSLPPRSPRSSKKRKAAADTTAGAAAVTDAIATPPPKTKKSKALAAASITTPPPTSAAKAGGLEGREDSSRSAASKDVEAAEGKEGQSLKSKSKAKDMGKASDGLVAGAAPGLGVAPKGRCVSGRDWKARNQSQRWVCHASVASLRLLSRVSVVVQLVQPTAVSVSSLSSTLRGLLVYDAKNSCISVP